MTDETILWLVVYFIVAVGCFLGGYGVGKTDAD